MADDSGTSPPGGDGSMVTIQAAMEVAMEMIANQRLDYAAEVLERIIEAVPEHATALNYLGILRFHLKGAKAAIELLTHAATVAPHYAGIRNNLGNAYVEIGDIDAAVDAYREAIRLDPALSDPYGNLASIMKNRGDAEEAESLLRRAVDLNPKNGYAHHNLANLLIGRGRADEAIKHYWKARALIPDKSTTSPYLALAYVNAGMLDEAAHFVRKWADDEPDDPQAQHLRASITGENIPPRAPDGYVANLFDKFATTFDAKLDILGYRAPEIVGDAVRLFAADMGPVLDIIDAGCGTGKCARYLTPYARSLVGVDLSKGMLAQADKLKAYDTLKKAELTAFLGRKTNACDMIVSADTLCYFGELEAFARVSAKALRRGGALIFTVEALDAKRREDFVLAYNGRYAHSEIYVRSTLEAAGFEVLRLVVDTLRMESGSPVSGLVVTARMVH